MSEQLLERKEFTPLYYSIKHEIKNKIKTGEYKMGMLIPSESSLIKTFGVSRTTVLKALSELVSEGFLVRIQGKGTYVSEPEPQFNANDIVGIAMRTHGHLYAQLSSGIISNLSAHELYGTVIEWKEEGGDYASLESLIQKNPAFLIVDGHDLFPYEVLDNYSGKLVFILRYKGKNHQRGSFFLSDYYKGGVLIASRFLSSGFRRVLCVMNAISGRDKVSLDVFRGISDTFRSNGIPENEVIPFFSYQDKGEIHKTLSSNTKPLAVWCESDAIATFVYDAANNLGLTIPNDISIIGYYDTPWCEAFSPKLTSVSVREQEIADLAAKKIKHHGDTNENVLLEPRLVERESVN